MRRALELAGRARGRTSPNPMVGAVIVKGGRIIAEGHHRRAGGPHAEIVALKKAGPRAKGGVLYLTLEPCTHLDKRTPPCVPAVARSGLRTVVVAMRDPNPKVAGRGLGALRRAGLQVRAGILKAQAFQLNESYIKHITTGLPFVVLKSAMSLDGKIASAKGSTTRITSRESLREAHRMRNEADAVLVGVDTVITDDPRLTTRIPGGRDARRVILDSTLRIPLAARVLRQKSEAATIVATTRRADPDKIRALEGLGAEVWVVGDRGGRVSLPDLMAELGRRGVTRVLIEGGGRVNASALSGGVVDKLAWFIAPVILGSPKAVDVIDGRNSGPESGMRTVSRMSLRRLGRDLLIEGYL
ncbi:MAG TPA: bifunctional diaminohydroxyphosphoribosylaminopyrimidine deaminase/5-amino-6-(5-phosphoribosylamino)uracil reductase RibD [Nitrospiria bacterium]